MTPDLSPVPHDDLPDWPARFAALTEAALARKQRTAELRAQLAAARTAGKAARHARRLTQRPQDQP